MAGLKKKEVLINNALSYIDKYIRLFPIRVCFSYYKLIYKNLFKKNIFKVHSLCLQLVSL